MTVHNVDDIIVKDMQNQQASVQAIPNSPQVEAPVSQTENIKNTETEIQDNKETKPDTNLSQDNSVPNLAQDEGKEVSKDTNKEVVAKDTNIDEYGNPVEKARTYTEDEVQRMIRDRLSRGRQAENQQPTQQQVQKATDEHKTDPNGEEGWEAQLDRVIDKRMDTRQIEIKQKEWESQQMQRQSDFEAKFNTGMSKYQDFDHVVSKAAPAITHSMMQATGTLDNPAAFLYAAAKLHPVELDRISRLDSGIAQAAEVGRLHEKMVKHRNVTSGAPKPIEGVKGDLPNKPLNPDRSIDQRIFDYAKQKRR